MAGPGHGILAGYDGSPGSEQALTWAAREARAREAVLAVCQAWAPGYPAPPAQVAAFDLARRSGEQTLARGVRQACGLMASSEVRPLLVAGPAAHILCERSAEAEMLVVSAGGMAASRGCCWDRSARRSPRMPAAGWWQCAGTGGRLPPTYRALS